jgi:hypothetical protein
LATCVHCLRCPAAQRRGPPACCRSAAPPHVPIVNYKSLDPRRDRRLVSR